MKAGLMLGVNPEAKREENDFYATDSYAIRIALPLFEKLGISKNIWECACGKGHLSKELVKAGYNVKSSDLIDRGYGEVLDFLNCTEKFDGDILTNPPFKNAVEFIETSMKLLNEGNKAFMFLKIQFLESERRRKLFEKYPPKYVIINPERICCAMNGEFDKYFSYDEKKGKYTKGTQCYCWYVFEKGYKGDSKLLWL